MRSITPPQQNNFFTPNVIRLALISFALLVATAGGAAIGITGQGTLIVIGLIGAGSGLMMVLRPAFGVTILVIFVYLNLSDVIEVAFGIPSLNKLLIAFIFVGVLGTRIVIQRRPIIFRTTEGAFLIYGLVMTVSSFFSLYSEDAFGHIIDFAKDFAIVLILIQVCDDLKTWKTMQWVLIISAAFLALLSCYQMLSGDTTNTFFGLANAPKHEIVAGFDNTRPTGPLDDPNFYAQVLMMILPFATYRVIDEKEKLPRLIALICAGLIVLAVVFTYSRGAFVMMLVVTFFIIQERRMNVYKIGALAVLILTLLTPILPAGYLDRIATITGTSDLAKRGQTEVSFQGRNSEMLVAIEMFLDHSLIGVGYASYDKNYQAYSRKLGMDNRTEARETHSLYLEVAAETGILGIGAFCFLYYAIFMSLHRARKQLLRINRPDLVSWVWGLQFGLISYLLTSFFLHDGYVRYLRLSIALAVSATAMVEALVRQHDEEKRKRGYV
jgi:putative inorganic carbon (hco3(-)) transporter